MLFGRSTRNEVFFAWEDELSISNGTRVGLKKERMVLDSNVDRMTLTRKHDRWWLTTLGFFYNPREKIPPQCPHGGVWQVVLLDASLFLVYFHVEVTSYTGRVVPDRC